MKTILCSLIMCLFLSLLGCQTTPQKEIVVSSKVDTVTVKIPVLIRCVSLKEIPTIPATNMIPSKDLAAEQMLFLLKADLDSFKEYAIVADSLLRGCLGGNSGGEPLSMYKSNTKEIK